MLWPFIGIVSSRRFQIIVTTYNSVEIKRNMWETVASMYGYVLACFTHLPPLSWATIHGEHDHHWNRQQNIVRALDKVHSSR